MLFPVTAPVRSSLLVMKWAEIKTDASLKPAKAEKTLREKICYFYADICYACHHLDKMIHRKLLKEFFFFLYFSSCKEITFSTGGADICTIFKLLRGALRFDGSSL